MKAKLIIIAAVSTDGVIGIDNEIAWRIPEDFQHFRKTTKGHMLIVGYNTYLTLPDKAFEGRYYFVLNNTGVYEPSRNNVYQFKDLETVLWLIQDAKNNFNTVFVAGGAMVYESLIDYCDEAIITWINKEIPNGNKKFPITNLFTNFEIILEDQDWQMSKTGTEYRIVHYKRTGNKKHIKHG